VTGALSCSSQTTQKNQTYTGCVQANMKDGSALTLLAPAYPRARVTNNVRRVNTINVFAALIVRLNEYSLAFKR
jgi:hypothetical protein